MSSGEEGGRRRKRKRVSISDDDSSDRYFQFSLHAHGFQAEAAGEVAEKENGKELFLQNGIGGT